MVFSIKQGERNCFELLLEFCKILHVNAMSTKVKHKATNNEPESTEILVILERLTPILCSGYLWKLSESSLIVKTYKNNPLVDLYSEPCLILAKSLFLVTFIINKLRTDYHYWLYVSLIIILLFLTRRQCCRKYTNFICHHQTGLVQSRLREKDQFRL